MSQFFTTDTETDQTETTMGIPNTATETAATTALKYGRQKIAMAECKVLGRSMAATSGVRNPID
jgi:hypothetical protein